MKDKYDDSVQQSQVTATIMAAVTMIETLIDLHLGLGPLSPDAPRPWLGWALCAPYQIMGAP